MNGLVSTEVVQSSGPHRVRPGTGPGLGIEALATQGRTSAIRLWWLGQAGFAVRHSGGTFLIDPYLSDSLAAKYTDTQFPHTRLHPPPVAAADLRGVNLVLHSHAHTDHLDAWTIEAMLGSNTPRFVAPRARRQVALERHIPAGALSAVTAGDKFEATGLQVTAVPAAHEALTLDENGDHVFLGYVIEVGGMRIYHSGDCTPYAGQSQLLASLGIDVALLPVNGRDAHRLSNGVPGNFTVDEAVALCLDAGIPELVCHHFGLFDFNTVHPATVCGRLDEIAGELAWTVPAVGAGFHLTKEAA